MLPKRIMDSSVRSVSKLIIEFEPLGTTTSQDSKLMQKNNAINTNNYGSITNTPKHEHQGHSSITSVLWNMLNQIIGTGIYVTFSFATN